MQTALQAIKALQADFGWCNPPFPLQQLSGQPCLPGETGWDALGCPGGVIGFCGGCAAPQRATVLPRSV